MSSKGSVCAVCADHSLRDNTIRAKISCTGYINPFKTNGIFQKFDTVNSRWPIVYIEGCKVRLSKNITSLSLKIDFV